MELSHRKIETIDKLERKQRYEFINKHSSLCIKYLNDNYISLGIVKPLLIKAYFENRDENDTKIHTTLFSDTLFRTMNDYEKETNLLFAIY
jgi:SRSO17 transposase